MLTDAIKKQIHEEIIASFLTAKSQEELSLPEVMIRLLFAINDIVRTEHVTQFDGFKNFINREAGDYSYMHIGSATEHLEKLGIVTLAASDAKSAIGTIRFSDEFISLYRQAPVMERTCPVYARFFRKLDEYVNVRRGCVDGKIMNMVAGLISAKEAETKKITDQLRRHSEVHGLEYDQLVVGLTLDPVKVDAMKNFIAKLNSPLGYTGLTDILVMGVILGCPEDEGIPARPLIDKELGKFSRRLDAIERIHEVVLKAVNRTLETESSIFRRSLGSLVDEGYIEIYEDQGVDDIHLTTVFYNVWKSMPVSITKAIVVKYHEVIYNSRNENSNKETILTKETPSTYAGHVTADQTGIYAKSEMPAASAVHGNSIDLESVGASRRNPPSFTLMLGNNQVKTVAVTLYEEVKKAVVNNLSSNFEFTTPRFPGVKFDMEQCKQFMEDYLFLAEFFQSKKLPLVSGNKIKMDIHRTNNEAELEFPDNAIGVACTIAGKVIRPHLISELYENVLAGLDHMDIDVGCVDPDQYRDLIIVAQDKGDRFTVRGDEAVHFIRNINDLRGCIIPSANDFGRAGKIDNNHRPARIKITLGGVLVPIDLVRAVYDDAKAALKHWPNTDGVILGSHQGHRVSKQDCERFVSEFQYLKTCLKK